MYLYPLCKPIFIKALTKACKRVGFAVVNVENGQQLGDGQQVLNFLRQIQKLERAALFINSRKTGDKLADAARIDVADAAKVEENFVFAFAQETANSIAKGNAALTDGHLPIQI